MKFFKKIRSVFKFGAVFLMIAILGFSNFVSFLPQNLHNNKLAENLKVKEAQAAVSLRAVEAYVYGTANLTPVIPATAAAGDMMLLAYGTKPYNDAPTITAGWTSIGSATNGTVAAGTDVGSMQTRIYYKEHSGSETNPTVTNATNNVSSAVIIVFQKAASEVWETPVGAGGGDATAGTGFSVTASANPGITAGDMLVGYAAIRSDAGTQSAIGITATGLTVNAFTESPATDGVTTSGGDMAMSGGYSLVTAGTASAAPVYASTLAASHTGSAFIVRLRATTPVTLTISQTAGSKVATKNSGDVDQYAHDTACTDAASCAAFTLAAANGTANVTSIKITESGTVTANTELSDANLYYDTDGNWSDAGAETLFGTAATFAADQTATISGTLAISAGATAYIYVRYDLANGTTYPIGGATVNFQIAAAGDVVSDGIESGSATLAGTTTILPKVSSVSYGAGLSDGARSSEAITISGYGFGVAPVGSRANCAGAVDTGCVRFLIGGAATVADSSVSSWSNTSIGWTVSSTLATLGGASSLELVSGSATSSSVLTYYIYPRVTGMTTCSAGGDKDNACGTNQSPEYVATDAFGLIKLNGDHFGSTAGTITFTGGITFPVHSTAEGACNVGGWAADGASVCSEVAAAIASSTNSGTITLTRNGDSKTDTIAFELLPRITSVTPTSEIVGNVVTIDGDHFCNVSSGCPASPPTSDYIVYFGATQAISSDFVATGNCAAQGVSWSDNRICVKVPSGAPTGSQKIKVVKKAIPNQESERENFTVNSTVPNDPDLGPGTNKGQFKSDASTAIGVGSSTNQSAVVFKMLMSVGPNSTLEPQVEIASTSASFVNSPTATGTAVAYTGTPVTGTVTISGIADNTYHWQARVRNTGTNEYSSWKSFPTNAGEGNPETATDFKTDTTAPTISFGSPDTCDTADGAPGTNNATITFNITNETADSGEIEYSTSSTFASGNQTQTDTVDRTSYSFNLTNLNSNTAYYWRVKTTDLAGNSACRSNGASGVTCPAPSPFCSFTTQSVSKPAKTTIFHATSTLGAISGGNTSTSTFSVYISEATSTVLIKSALLEITGLVSGGANPIDIKVNDMAIKSYSINATNPTHFKFIYQIPIPDPLPETRLNLNDITPCTNGNPSGTAPCNKLTITPGAGMTINVASAKIILTYAYSP